MDIEAVILDLTDDDFFGLREFQWRLAALAAAGADPVPQAALERAMKELLTRGKIALYSGVNFQGEEEQVSLDDALVVISRSEMWTPPERDGRHYRATTTSMT